ncbi:hypothetical protein BOS5A_230198 [Bosea sp. EC-HK365B]|nr:hypothetical protein BOSE21B_90274 [Bosea sp. 21B]CAD5298508.1 hypothetical protein BOSE7B_60391 [Bosea sp. 7B]VVT60921.1 hypothetical protein BOS5A_230198 [Bosea sp. EC-HK365B]VXB36474.1 hypothetical protein BOSE127_110390 [Bosea sp. 127]
MPPIATDRVEALVPIDAGDRSPEDVPDQLDLFRPAVDCVKADIGDQEPGEDRLQRVEISRKAIAALDNDCIKFCAEQFAAQLRQSARRLADVYESLGDRVGEMRGYEVRAKAALSVQLPGIVFRATAINGDSAR